jgi:ABC-type sulfate transport system permease component
MIAGFIALFEGFGFFFALIIWILGFAVLLPIAAIFMNQEDELTDEEWWSTWFGWWHPIW